MTHGVLKILYSILYERESSNSNKDNKPKAMEYFRNQTMPCRSLKCLREIHIPWPREGDKHHILVHHLVSLLDDTNLN